MHVLLLTALLALLTTSWVHAAEKKKGSMNNYLKRTGAKFIAEMAKKEGFFELKSGMVVEIIKSGDDPMAKSPKAGDACDVTYAGTLRDGTPFDKGTTSFAPNQVIKGWTEAMQLMGEGDKWRLYIPYDLAYGERGSPPKIPPFSPLVFEIESKANCTLLLLDFMLIPEFVVHKVKSGGKPVSEARAMFEEAVKKKEEL